MLRRTFLQSLSAALVGSLFKKAAGTPRGHLVALYDGVPNRLGEVVAPDFALPGHSVPLVWRADFEDYPDIDWDSPDPGHVVGEARLRRGAAPGALVAELEVDPRVLSVWRASGAVLYPALYGSYDVAASTAGSRVGFRPEGLHLLPQGNKDERVPPVEVAALRSLKRTI